MSTYRILMMIHRLDDASPYCFFVHEQAKALREMGHDVVVISPVCEMPLAGLLGRRSPVFERTPEKDVLDGIPIYFPRCHTYGNRAERILGGSLMARAILPIARRLHAEKPFDLIHAHMLDRDGHAGLLVGKKLHLPVALTVHGTDVLHYFEPGKKPLPRNAAIAAEVDALMAVSSSLMKRVQPYRAADAISEVVPNGVDLSLVPDKTKNRPGAIVSIGTLKERKCMDRTIDAFAHLAPDYPSATLKIVGVGELDGVLREQVERLHMTDRITFTGGISHPAVLSLLADSDMMVLPSWGEGYGIVYIEAMAAGCIAVGAQGEGIEDTITDGVNGFLIPAGDTAATEAVMRKVLDSPQKYAALRERGRQDARHLTWRRNAQQVTEIYRRMLAHSAVREDAYAKEKRH